MTFSSDEELTDNVIKVMRDYRSFREILEHDIALGNWLIRSVVNETLRIQREARYGKQ